MYKLFFRATIGCALALPSISSAQIFTWNQDANADWNLESNWTPGGGPPNAIGVTANITNDITGNRDVRVNAEITIGIINIGDNNGSNVFALTASGGNLTFDNTGITNAQLNKIFGQNTTVAAPLILNDTLRVYNNQTTVGNANVLAFTGSISGSGGMIFATDQPTGAAVAGTGAASFTSSNLVLNASTSFTGATTLEKGDLTINSSGSSAGSGLQGTSELTFRGGNIVVRNGSSGTDNDRINNSADFRVQSLGTFVYRTANAAYAASESVDKLILENGTFQYRVMNEAPTGFSATFTFSDLERTGATNFSFANFGSGNTVLGNATTLGTNRLFFTNINGASSGNSTFLGGWATYGSYTNFAAYNTVNGVTAATQTTLAASSNDGSVNFLRSNTSLLTLNAGSKSMNTLALGVSSSSVDINGTLTLVGGGLTFGANPTGAAQSHSLSNGFIQVGNTAGADTLFLSVGAQTGTTANITAVIQNNGSDVLTVAKGGPGQAIFDNAMTYTGATYVESGALTLGASGSLANGNVVVRRNANFEMLGGSAIRFNIDGISTADQFVQNEGGLFTLNGTMTLDFSSALSGTWDLFSLTSGSADGFTAINLTGAFTGPLTELAGVWSGTSGGYEFTFTESTGVLTSVVPEPGTWLLVSVGLTTLMVFRRRSRS